MGGKKIKGKERKKESGLCFGVFGRKRKGERVAFFVRGLWTENVRGKGRCVRTRVESTSTKCKTGRAAAIYISNSFMRNFQRSQLVYQSSEITEITSPSLSLSFPLLHNNQNPFFLARGIN